jgi:hypothetical protein
MALTKVPNELLSDPHIGVGITDTATSAKLAVSDTGIDVTGNVGIGTNPLQKLHIDTGASGLPAIRLSHTNTGADNFDITAGTPG